MNNHEYWNFYFTPFSNIHIESDGVIDIKWNDSFNPKFVMAPGSRLLIKDKGTLVIRNKIHLFDTNTFILNDNTKVIVEQGGTLFIRSISDIVIKGSGKIEIKSGGYIWAHT